MKTLDVAIISMACCLHKLTDMTSLWRKILNQNDKKQHTGNSTQHAKHHASTIEQVLTDVVNDISPDLQKQDLQKVGLFTQQTFQDEAKQVLDKLGIQTHYNNTIENDSGTFEPEIFHAIQSLVDHQCDLAIVADFSSSPSSKLNADIGTSFVLKRWKEAEADHNTSYALIKVIESICIEKHQLRQDYTNQNILPETIAYLIFADSQRDSSLLPDEISQLYSQEHAKVNTLAVARSAINTDTEHSLPFALIQASLALSNKIILGNTPGVEEICGIHAPIYFSNVHRPWFHSTNSPEPRRAAIYLKQQVHLVLEEIPEFHPCARLPDLPFSWESEVAVFSADSDQQLINQLDSLLKQIHEDEEKLYPIDIAAHLARQLDMKCNYRLALVFKDVDEIVTLAGTAIEHLQKSTKKQTNSKIYYAKIDDSTPHGLACIFPGLGFPGIIGQYADNLLQLCVHFPEVRQVFDLVESRGMDSADPYPTSHLFFPGEGYDQETQTMLKQRLASPRYVDAHVMEIPEQKNLSSFGVAVANWSSWRLIQSLGIPVDMLFGQSQGELSALCAGGKIDFNQFIKMHWETDIDPGYISDGGRLALASTSEEKLTPIISDFPTISIAVHIAPEFLIIGGDEKEILACIESLKTASVWTQILPYPAIHTPHFTSLRTSMEPELENIAIYPSTLPVYSGLTGKRYAEDAASTRKGMIENLDHPVLLWQTTRNMYKDGASILLQAGGGATMYSQAKTNIGADDVIATSIDVDYRGPLEQLNHMCATLFTSGLSFDLEQLYKNRKPVELTWESLQKPIDYIEINNVYPLLDEQQDESIQIVNTNNTESEHQDNSGSLPFSGEVLEYTEGKSILVIYTLDLNEDLYLADHAFVFAQNIKLLNECLPVVPMTVSLEIMAEVAAYLAPGCGLIGFQDIIATNWIALRESDQHDLKISATWLNHESELEVNRVYVEITSFGSVNPDIKGIILLSKQYQVSLEFKLSELTNAYTHPQSIEEIYQSRSLFHGPLYRCISGETLLGDHGLIGELIVLDKSQMFKSNSAPFLMTDPMLLDAVGQLVGLWAMERGLYVFPITLELLEIYSPTPPIGTRVPVSIQIQKSLPKTLSVDVEIQDGSGNVWMRIKNWGDWAFQWPKVFADYRRLPRQYFMSDKLELNSDDQVTARIMKRSLITSDMEELLARLTLHSSEMQKYLQMAKFPHRQKQWLFGRIVVKDAIRNWLGQRNMNAIHPASIIIDTKDKGRPIMRSLPGYSTPHISLSHTNKLIIAIAADVEIGIDVEAIQDREEVFVRQFASTNEIDILQQTETNLAQGITQLWVAKESFSKALGTGLPGNPKLIELQKINEDNSTFLLYHKSRQLQAEVKTWEIDEHIIALSSGRQIIAHERIKLVEQTAKRNAS